MNNELILQNHRARTASQCLKVLGGQLRVYRINKGITQERMAYLCRCTRLTIHKIENGSEGVAIIYFFRYLVALDATSLLKPFEDIIPNPVYIKHTVKFRRRVKTKKS